MISSSAERKTPTEKSPGRLFVLCLEEKRGRLWEGVCVCGKGTGEKLVQPKGLLLSQMRCRSIKNERTLESEQMKAEL